MRLYDIWELLLVVLLETAQNNEVREGIWLVESVFLFFNRFFILRGLHTLASHPPKAQSLSL
jgi:hypothetical protein